MSSFLSQALQSTTSQNTASVISSLNSSSGVPLTDPSGGVVNFPGTFIDGGNYSVIQIAIRSDTTCVVSVIQSFTGADDDMDGFVTDSYTLSAEEALAVTPVTLYYYISCPHVKVQVVNLQAGNTLFQLAVKLTSASPPVTASATSGDTYTAVDGIPYLNTYIGGQTIIINPTSTVNASLVGVNIVSSQLAVKDAAAETSLASIDGKITACNTGAAVLAGVTIDRSQLTVYDADCHAHLSTINTGINKASSFTDVGAVGLKLAGSVSASYDLGTIQNRYINATFMGACVTSTYDAPNFIFQYSFNTTDWFSDGVEPSFYVNGVSSSFVFQRASCPSRYVRLLFVSDTFLSSLQIVLSK
jgi:hypothetical protein